MFVAECYVPFIWDHSLTCLVEALYLTEWLLPNFFIPAIAGELMTEYFELDIKTQIKQFLILTHLCVSSFE